MKIRLGIDIGGTFTDFMAVDEEGRMQVFKTLSTPRAPEEAVFTGIEALAAEYETDVNGFLADVALIVHGTTMATNTVLERNGPKVGLLHTEGFRDIMFLRDGFKPRRYDVHVPPPEPLVPRYLRLPVKERILYTGEELTPVDEESVRAALQTFKEEGVESIGVCLLWSIVNPDHELRIREIIAEELPDAYVSLSFEILPAMREYPRASATTLSAYVGPVLGDYLTRLDKRLRDHGYGRELLIMQSTGGSAVASQIEKLPVLAIGSGPAAGPPAAVEIGREEEERDLILVEMGGTSFEVSLIDDAQIPISKRVKVADMPIGVAAVDIHSIGAGGGSIAWIDSGGMLRVGPESARADPGPACYGLGGVEPTVTDANLVLGYLNPDYFLGGRLSLDRSKSIEAVNRIAHPLGLDTIEAAAAIYQIANAHMVGAMHTMSVMRGIDPRDYTVVVGGGAGGTHAAKIAEELGVRKAICPTVAGGLCAFGMLVADMRHSYLATYPANTGTLDVDRVNALFEGLEAKALEELEAQGFTRDQIILERFVDAKYPYQSHEIVVPLASGTFSGDDVPRMEEVFHDHHERLYNYCLRGMSVDINGWRVNGIAKLPALNRDQQPVGDPDPARAHKGTREAYFPELGGFVPTAIFDGTLLQNGMTLEGPAIVELPTTTVVVFPGHVLTANSHGDYHIAIPRSEGKSDDGIAMLSEPSGAASS